MHKYAIVAVCAVVVIIIIAFVLFSRRNKENFTNKSVDAITLYHSPHCPHCVAFMPVWDEFAAKSPVAAKKVDCTKDACPNIGGFPTVILQKNGKTVEFNKTRTVKDLMEFANSA